MYSDPEIVNAYREVLKGCEDNPLYDQWVLAGERGVNYILESEGIKKMARFLSCELKEARILDMGAGTGNGIVAFHLLGASHCFGIDIEMNGLGLRLAQSRLRRHRIPDNLTAASGMALPFYDETFDIAFSHNVIEHVEDLFSYLKEMYRVLKPRGIGLIGTPNRVRPLDGHFNLWFAPWLPNRLLRFYATLRGRHKGKLWDTYWRTPWCIIRMLRKAGFEIIATTQHYLNPTEKSQHRFRRRIIDILLNLGLRIDYLFPTIRLCVRKNAKD